MKYNHNHPTYYTSHPSGVECIEITRKKDFCIGNAIKYLWRQGLKEEDGVDIQEKQLDDIKKAIWYAKDELSAFPTVLPQSNSTYRRPEVCDKVVQHFAEPIRSVMDTLFSCGSIDDPTHGFTLENKERLTKAVSALEALAERKSS